MLIVAAKSLLHLLVEATMVQGDQERIRMIKRYVAKVVAGTVGSRCLPSWPMQICVRGSSDKEGTTRQKERPNPAAPFANGPSFDLLSIVRFSVLKLIAFSDGVITGHE